jgi:hypothetical protein
MKTQFSAQLADVDSRASAARRCTRARLSHAGVRAAGRCRHRAAPRRRGPRRQLAETIDRIKAANVQVLFAEKYFASKLADTIKDATGVQMYSFSHMSDGDYSRALRA